jgi:hypothetical protein
MVRLGADTVTNPIPEKLARVIPGKDIPVNLGPEGAKDVFVTAAEDIRGLNPKEISERLAVPYSKTYTIIEWNKPATGMATPINRLNPNFVGGGLTKGGAREYVIPNQLLPQDAKIRIVE